MKNTLLEQYRKIQTKDFANRMYFYIKSAVESKDRKFLFPDEVKNNLYRFAEIVTDDNPIYGILLMGKCGTGKSLLTKAFMETTWYYSRSGVIDFKYDYERPQWVNVQDYIDYFLTNEEEYRKYQKCKILILDDMGNEYTEVVKYGTKMKPIEDLVDYRYRHDLLTVITTNVPSSKMGEKYSERFADRLKEMFPPKNQLVFNHESYRKQ